MRIAVHARRKGDNRDYSSEKWDDLCKELKRLYSAEILAIGLEKDYCPKGAEDRRTSDLFRTREVIQSCQLVMGGSSGLMHFASLSRVPHLVWGDPDYPIPEIAPSSVAYATVWNPFNTPVVYLGEGWDPGVQEILDSLKVHFDLSEYPGLPVRKCKSAKELQEIISNLRETDRCHIIGLANGVFDLLHEGHIACLQYAKDYCDTLIVALNSDASTKRLKGAERPVWDVAARTEAVARLDFVDYVVIFDQDWPEEFINELDPDVLFKGESYRGREVAGSTGRTLIFTPEVEGISTTKLIGQSKAVESEKSGERTVSLNRTDSGYNTIVENTAVEEVLTERYAHFFWNGPNFDYAQYLSIKSACLVHRPDHLIIWTTDPPAKEEGSWWSLLLEQKIVDVRDASELLGSEVVHRYLDAAPTIKAVMDALGHGKHYKAAQISDMVAWKAIYDYGGIYLDTDTLSYRPLWEIVEDPANNDFILCGIPATGFLAGCKGSSFAQALVEKNLRQLDQPLNSGRPWNQWTRFGPTALIEEIGARLGEYSEIPAESIYKFSSQRDLPFKEDFRPELTDGIRILHYYGEGRNELGTDFEVNEITEEFVRTSTSLFAGMAREIIVAEQAREIVEQGEKISLTKKGEDVVIDPNVPRNFVPETEDSRNRPFLSMCCILHDEADQIPRCFGSVADCVDQIVAVVNPDPPLDSDLAAIQKFQEEHPALDVKVVVSDWLGFSPTRNKAIRESDGEYIMKMDLDEELVNGVNLRKVLQKARPKVLDTYNYDSVRFQFPRVWHRSAEARWEGIIHEKLLTNVGLSGHYLMDDSLCHVIHHSRKEYPPELERTSALCREGIDRNPADARLMFYLARECMRLGHFGEAEYWFRRRIVSGGYWEERLFSQLYLGDLLVHLGKKEEATDIWQECSKNLGRKLREPCMRLGNWLMRWNQFDAAYQWYAEALKRDKIPHMGLFVYPKLYQTDTTDQILFYLSWLSWKTRPDAQGAKQALEYLDKLEKSNPRADKNRQVFRSMIAE